MTKSALYFRSWSFVLKRVRFSCVAFRSVTMGQYITSIFSAHLFSRPETVPIPYSLTVLQTIETVR